MANVMQHIYFKIEVDMFFYKLMDYEGITKNLELALGEVVLKEEEQ